MREALDGEKDGYSFYSLNNLNSEHSIAAKYFTFGTEVQREPENLYVTINL